MKEKIMGVVVVFLVITLLIGVSLETSDAEELPIVTAIEIDGLTRIGEGAVRERISKEIGEILCQRKLSDDIRAIYKLGHFDDVWVEVEPFEGGIRVIYVVKETPVIAWIDFQGNNRFDDSALKKRIVLAPGATADITLIKDNAARLRAFYEYKGYYLARVVPVTKTIREGEVSVTFQIDEGQRVRIKDIEIRGNKALSMRKIRGVMETTEHGILSFILGGGHFSRDIMRADIERIKALYHNHGYIQVIVKEPEIELTEDRKGLMISIQIVEGEQFRVSSVEISGNEAFSTEELQGLIRLSPQMVFSKEILREDISAVISHHANNGFPFAFVFPDITIDEEKKEIKIIYRVSEGGVHRVGRITISGNVTTRDHVIRRELLLDEADVFSAAKLRESHRSLLDLRFFETIDVSTVPVPEDLIDIHIEVEEMPTGFFSIGGGYSNIDGFIAMADVAERNLFGRGHQIRLRAELGERRVLYELSFKEPWFMERPISFGVGIHRTEREFALFDRRATGARMSFGKGFWEYWGASIAYRYENVVIFNVDPRAGRDIREQEGTRVTSSITMSGGRDTRDSIIAPREGSRNMVTTTIAGLGGDTGFFRGVFDSGWFFPVFGDATIHLRGRIGYATGLFDKELPLYERFYVGGIHTVRGLGFGEAGPIDPGTGEPEGGKSKIVFNAEYIFPILAEHNLKGVAFFDAGRAYASGPAFGSDLRYTTGVGVRWISPIGPIRIEWGYNISPKPGEDQSRLEFTIGAPF